MLKIAICDDEPFMCGLLKEKIEEYLQKGSKEFKIFCYPNGESLPVFGDFDIVLLDVQMPGINGMELAKRLRENGNSCAVIFVTILKEPVFDAFEVDAVDYLCKPVDEVRLKRALERAIRRIDVQKGKALLIHTMNHRQSVKLDSILYCEVFNRKILLHTQQGVIEYYSRLSDVENQLDKRFAKCHRSYLVNLDYLSECSKGQIILTNGERIPVSKARWQSFMSQMLHYMKDGVEP